MLQNARSDSGKAPNDKPITRCTQLAEDKNTGIEEEDTDDGRKPAEIPLHLKLHRDVSEVPDTSEREDLVQSNEESDAVVANEKHFQKRSVSFSGAAKHDGVVLQNGIERKNAPNNQSYLQQRGHNFTPQRLQSFQSSAGLSNKTNDQLSQSAGPCSCSSWSHQRLRVAGLGCISSVCVLVVRLWLDIGEAGYVSSTYIIHSIIILLDMILIHLFTFAPWLSGAGELTTMICFLSYHFTQEKVFELMETTFIAALCSIHMIRSRNKHMYSEEKLARTLDEVRYHYREESYRYDKLYGNQEDETGNGGDGQGANNTEQQVNIRTKTLTVKHQHSQPVSEVNVDIESNGLDEA